MKRKRGGGYQIKLTDFGGTASISDPKKSLLATAGYESPQIAAYYENPTTTHHKYFNDRKSPAYKEAQTSYGKSLAHTVIPRMTPFFGKPNLPNDMWSLGVLFFEIETGLAPSHINSKTIAELKNPLIKGLLHPRQKKRLNIFQAIALHNQQSALASPHITRHRKN
jgi:serine/threonine protein kinase